MMSQQPSHNHNFEVNVMNKLPLLVPLLIALSGAISSHTYASEQINVEPIFNIALQHDLAPKINATSMKNEIDTERLLTKQLTAMEERWSADVDTRFNSFSQLR
jgi:hypothetical protein